jgi:hypothetical protein
MTLADLTPEEKNKISHRGIALKNFMMDMGLIKERTLEKEVKLTLKF